MRAFAAANLYFFAVLTIECCHKNCKHIVSSLPQIW
jgi:hypothetical protein